MIASSTPRPACRDREAGGRDGLECGSGEMFQRCAAGWALCYRRPRMRGARVEHGEVRGGEVY